MKISTCFPSKFLKAADIGDANVRVVMSRLSMEEVVNGEDKKPVLYFHGKDKGVVLNKTNSKVIANTYGDDTDAWIGQPLILFSAMVDFKGDMVEAIRVRVPKAAPATPKASKIESGPAKKATPRHSDEAMPEEHENPAPAEMDDEVPF